MCVSPEEHFNIHLKQGDIVALNGKFIQGASEAGKIGGKKSKIIWDDSKKRNLSKALRKSYNDRGGSPLKGRKISEKHKKNIGLANIGEKNSMFGKKHSEESKLKMSNNSKGRKAWNKGIAHTEETKNKIAEKAKGRKLTPEQLKKSIDNRIQLKLRWYNDGNISIFVPEHTQSENFKLGRLKFK
jgi:hypothetical protein